MKKQCRKYSLPLSLLLLVVFNLATYLNLYSQGEQLLGNAHSEFAKHTIHQHNNHNSTDSNSALLLQDIEEDLLDSEEDFSPALSIVPNLPNFQQIFFSDTYKTTVSSCLGSKCLHPLSIFLSIRVLRI